MYVGTHVNRKSWIEKQWRRLRVTCMSVYNTYIIYLSIFTYKVQILMQAQMLIDRAGQGTLATPACHMHVGVQCFLIYICIFTYKVQICMQAQMLMEKAGWSNSDDACMSHECQRAMYILCIYTYSYMRYPYIPVPFHMNIYYKYRCIADYGEG